MASEELKIQRDLVKNQLESINKKLLDALLPANQNVRKITKLLKDLCDTYDVTISKQTAYLAKAKKDANDPVEKTWFTTLDDLVADTKYRAEEFLENENDTRAAEENIRTQTKERDKLVRSLKINVDGVNELVDLYMIAVSSDAPPSPNEYKDEIVFMESKFKLIYEDTKKHIDLLTEVDSDDVLRSLDTSERSFRTKMKALKRLAKEKGVQPNVRTPPDPDSNPSSRESSPSRQSNLLKPKKVDFPKFAGNIREFNIFTRHYNDMVVKTNAYAPEQLLHILKYECLTGEPQKLIKHYLDYDAAWDKLNEVYKDDRQIVRLVTKQIEEYKKISDSDHNHFIKYVECIERGYIDLTALGKSNIMDHPSTLDTIEKRCPDWVIRLLVTERNLSTDTAKDSFEYLLNFLKAKSKESRILALNSPSDSNKQQVKKQNQSVHSTTATSNQDKSFKCLVSSCNNKTKHFLSKCGAFKAMDCNQVGKLVLDKKLCIICFHTKHDASDCPRKTNWKPCDVLVNNSPCDKWHNRKIHGATTKGLVLNICTQLDNFLSPAILLTQNIETKEGENCRVIWDHCSTTSLVTHDFAMRIGSVGTDCEIDLTVADGSSTTYQTKVYMISLKDVSNNIHKIFAYGLENLTDQILSYDTRIVEDKFPDFDVKLDPAFGKMDLLVGVNYAGLLPTHVATEKNLLLYQSRFGTEFLLCGTPHDFEQVQSLALSAKNLSRNTACFIKTPDFFTVEAFGTDPPRRCKTCSTCKECSFRSTYLSWQENKELKIIEEGLSLDTTNKKWTCTYPFKEDPSVLNDNYGQAKALLCNLERRLLKNGRLDEFNTQFQDSIDRGIFRAIPEEDEYNGPVNYISIVDAYKTGPHSTTPLRLCMNSSLKFQGKSLNDILLKGPSALADLYGLGLRFRSRKVAFIRDLSKFYQSVLVGEREQNLRRVLWRGGKVDEKPTKYVTTTNNFGDKPAGCIAQTALRKTAKIYREICPLAAEAIVNDTFSDDTLSGASSREEANLIVDGMDKIVSYGGFQYKDAVFSGDKNDGEPRKVLGVGWDTESDTLFIDAKLNFTEKKKGLRKEPDLDLSNLEERIPTQITKRMVWRVVMSQFDLLGLASVFMVRLKLTMRELSKENTAGLKWDDPIPDDEKVKFIQLLTMLIELKDLRFPRSLIPTDADDSLNPEMIIMVDGSTQAYCCLVYIRWKLNDGSYWCRLMTGKTRVAPLKKISIPRMELQAAVLGVRMACKVEEFSGFIFDRKYYLTDSSAVLGMIRSDCSIFLEFVGTRISEIRSKSNVYDWFWVSTDQNLSDLGTRQYTSPQEMHIQSEYQVGLPWMYEKFELWPVAEKVGIIPEDEMLKVHRTLAIVESRNENLIDLKKFSSYDKVVNAVAVIFLAVEKFKQKNKNTGCAEKLSVFIDQKTREKSEKFLILQEQKLFVHDFFKKYAPLRPRLMKVDFFPDLKGMVVVSGRAGQYLAVGYDKTELPLLDHKSQLSRLIMTKSHNVDHSGIDRTLQRSRTIAWISRGRVVAKTVVNQCFECKRRNKVVSEQVMAPLPLERVQPSNPFKSTAVDLFGPISIRDTVKKRVCKETYGVVFCCMVTSAVHLEVAETYNTDSFIQCLRRFMLLRGTPEYIQCDPGTQLVAASKIVEKWNLDEVAEFAEKKHISWHIIPTNSQHYNGCAESMIKSVKKQLTNVLFSSTLTKGELDTLFAEVMHIVNSRPLMIAAGSDPLSGGPITPNHLLHGRATTDVPEMDTDDNVKLLTRVKFIEDLKKQFWSKWIAQVFPKLVPSQKWHISNRNIMEGDIVLMQDSNKIKVGYKLAKVSQVFPSSDGKVRRVKVQYKNIQANTDLKSLPYHTTERSIHKLAVIVPADWSPEDVEVEVTSSLKTTKLF